MYGCYNSRTSGGYHCHRGALAGQGFSSHMIPVGCGHAVEGKRSVVHVVSHQAFPLEASRDSGSKNKQQAAFCAVSLPPRRKWET